MNSENFNISTKPAREQRIWFERVKLTLSMTKDSPEDYGKLEGLKESYKVQMGKFKVLEYVCSPRMDNPLC